MPKTPKITEQETVSSSQALDESFEAMRRMAQSMCQTLGRPLDRTICRDTLAELSSFNQFDSIGIKQNVRIFTRFYLKVLHWTLNNQPISLYQQWYDDGCENGNCNSEQPFMDNQDEMHWLAEDSSFFAMKNLDDGSMVIYSAVAKDPSAGWVDNGFKALRDELEKIEANKI